MGKDMETNTIYSGDCKEVLSKFPDNSIDLIYVDPPFFTQKNYEVIWNDGYEIRSFKDAQYYSKNGKRREDIYVYLDWLKDRIEQCYRILKDTGSFYIHCDWHANAYIKVYILDKVFGKNRFQNEIIWTYKTQGASKKRFARKHDTIFFYSKTNNWKFNTQYEKSFMMHIYGFKGSDFKIDPETGKQYNIVIRKDVWEIPAIQSVTKENLGYPTQKPKNLLDLIIKASSNENNIILDPMCGCGTAIASAQSLKRNWIGIDISPTACKLMNNRLRKLGASPKMIGMPATVKQLRKIQHFDFQNWVIERLGGRVSSKKVGDMGIDGVTFDSIPIQVKQSDKVGRNVVDNFETAVRRYFAGSKREKQGIIIAFSFTDGAYNEAHRVGLEGNIKLILKTVEELLNEK
jgi:DNA modification methylase